MQEAGLDRVLMVNKFLHEKGGAELYMYRLAELLEDSWYVRAPKRLVAERERET